MVDDPFYEGLPQKVEFRPIPTFPDVYLAGEDGSIWTCLVRGSRLGKRGRWWRMKTPPEGKRYPVINLRRNGKTVLRGVHVFVAMAFHGLCPEGMECRHLDGDRTNCRASNLCWGTQKENADDKRLHGTHVEGVKHYRAVLTEEQVMEILALLDDDAAHSAIAPRFGVSVPTISSIAAGQSWKHLNTQERRATRSLNPKRTPRLLNE